MKKLATILIVLAMASLTNAATIISHTGDTNPTSEGFGTYWAAGAASNETVGNPGSPPTWNFGPTGGKTSGFYYYDFTAGELDLTKDSTITMRLKADIENSSADGGLFMTGWGRRVEASFWDDGTIRMHNGAWQTLGNHNYGWVDVDVFYDASEQEVTWTFGGSASGVVTYAMSALTATTGDGTMRLNPGFYDGAPDWYFYVSELTLDVVPEPVTISVLGLGGLGLLMLRRRR